MILKKIVIENYKAFRHAEIEFQPDVTIIMGTNASGKTSLMEVIDLLTGITQNSQQDWLRRLFLARSRDGFVGCFPWMNTQHPMAFEIHVDLEGTTIHYRLALAADTEGRPHVVEERLWDNHQTWAHWDPDSRSYQFPPVQKALSIEPTYPLILSQRGEWFFSEHGMDIPLRFIRWVQRWYVIRPQTLGAGRSWENLDTGRNTQLARDGANFIPVLFYWKTLPTLQPRWEWICEYTRTLFEHLQLEDLEWDVVPKHQRERERMLVQLRIWPKDAKYWEGYDIAFGPDGLRQWFIVLMALCEPTASFVAIEEPEAHLDIRMVDILADAIRSADFHFNRPIGRQILLTTHSPILAGEWPPEHLRVIQRGVIQPVPEFLAHAVREKRIQLLEAWLMDMLTEVSQE